MLKYIRIQKKIENTTSLNRLSKINQIRFQKKFDPIILLQVVRPRILLDIVQGRLKGHFILMKNYFYHAIFGTYVFPFDLGLQEVFFILTNVHSIMYQLNVWLLWKLVYIKINESKCIALFCFLGSAECEQPLHILFVVSYVVFRQLSKWLSLYGLKACQSCFEQQVM